MNPAAKALVLAAMQRKAQADWSDRANDIHDAKTCGGIAIGYDRAMQVVRDMQEEQAQ